jgi:YegS/Rv2252/BmrU family lipid kinase
MKAFLVLNPRSANGRTGRHFDSIAQAVRGAVGDHGHAFTERSMHAAELTRAALHAGHDLVIAVGGDGTINEVVNGFFEPALPGQPPRPIREGAALAIVPHGTGGDLRRTLGLDDRLAESCARLKGERRRVDIGRVDYTLAGGGRAARYFINVGDVGVGAKIVEIANRGSKALGAFSFTVASLRGLMGWRDVRVNASFDGAPKEELTVTTLAIGNGRYFGGGLMVAPEARLDDGLFHVTIWTHFTMMDFATKGGAMRDGSHVKLPGTRTRTAQTITLEAAQPGAIGVEVDGELLGQLPATFTVLPGALPLVC